jgi:hypothetical protein
MAITLPAVPSLGASGHITDHTKIRTALSDLDAAKANSADLAAKANSADLGLTFIAAANVVAGASLTVNNCFSSTYEVYRIHVSNMYGSTTTSATFRLRASGTDATTGYSQGYIMGVNTTVSASRLTSQTSWPDFLMVNASSAGGMTAEIFAPADSGSATSAAWSIANTTDGGVVFHGVGYHSTVAAYTGFTLTAVSGTLTCFVRVYGYRKA